MTGRPGYSLIDAHPAGFDNVQGMYSQSDGHGVDALPVGVHGEFVNGLVDGRYIL